MENYRHLYDCENHCFIEAFNLACNFVVAASEYASKGNAYAFPALLSGDAGFRVDIKRNHSLSTVIDAIHAIGDNYPELNIKEYYYDCLVRITSECSGYDPIINTLNVLLCEKGYEISHPNSFKIDFSKLADNINCRVELFHDELVKTLPNFDEIYKKRFSTLMNE